MGEKTIVKSETLSEEKLAEARRKIMHWQKITIHLWQLCTFCLKAILKFQEYTMKIKILLLHSSKNF